MLGSGRSPGGLARAHGTRALRNAAVHTFGPYTGFQTTHLKERHDYISGPVLGGLPVQSSWRWIFLINLPIILATLAAGVAILPRRSGKRGSERSDRRPGGRIDGVGTVLVLGAVGLVCTALTEAPG
jgi:hypothetical protein